MDPSITTEITSPSVCAYGYPQEYQGPKPIKEQVNILSQLFPGIGSADEKIVEQSLPPNAEGWFAIPKWEKIAPTYGEAVEKVLDLIKQTRNGVFYNYCEGELGPQYLRQLQKTSNAFQKLGDKQKDHDILVVPAQFGFHHRGRSVCQALEGMNASEFGVGSFAAGIMLLTHPKRLLRREQIHIFCAGDEYFCDFFRYFNSTPVLCFSFDRVEFNICRADTICKSNGPASGFVF